MNVTILNENQFIDKVLPHIDDWKDTFFISIKQPDEKEALREDSENYRTYWFYDVEEDFVTNSHSYKAISEEQAKDMFEFIKKHSNKNNFIVHCAAGVSRSGAVGSFVHEYFGGKYKELLKKHPNILPNGRVTRLLRMYERIDAFEGRGIKIDFI